MKPTAHCEIRFPAQSGNRCARRGQGYVLVEPGKLDEAEEKYQQCIAANPNDSKAKAELDYVRKRKEKESLDNAVLQPRKDLTLFSP
jgi:hypothetical protein